MSEDDNVLVFSDLAFQASDGSSAFGFLMLSNGSIFGARACKGPKLCSSNKDETRAILYALIKSKERRFSMPWRWSKREKEDWAIESVMDI